MREENSLRNNKYIDIYFDTIVEVKERKRQESNPWHYIKVYNSKSDKDPFWTSYQHS